jgi:alpha-glucuronidase
LCLHSNNGVKQAAAMQATWQGLADNIDPQRHQEVADKLAIQVKDSALWRQQILDYFATFSKMPIIPA